MGSSGVTTFKLRANALTGERHVHVQVFSGPTNQTLASVGQLIFLPHEYLAFKRLLIAGQGFGDGEVETDENGSVLELVRGVRA
jgi:hypothetical protein